jgi:hypothetical protein
MHKMLAFMDKKLLNACCIHAQQIYKNHIKNSERLTSLNALATCKPKVTALMIKPPSRLQHLLKREGYSEKAVKEVWKWYDFSERKGVASF